MAFFPGIKRQAPGLSDMRWKRATACFPADSRLAGFTLRGTQRQRPPKGCIRNAVGTRRRGQKRFRRCHFLGIVVYHVVHVLCTVPTALWSPMKMARSEERRVGKEC